MTSSETIINGNLEYKAVASFAQRLFRVLELGNFSAREKNVIVDFFDVFMLLVLFIIIIEWKS